jgi:ribose transport system ATP-binding protein
MGIAGLVGAGRTELLKLIAGIDKSTSGQISVGGKCAGETAIASAIRAESDSCQKTVKKKGSSKNAPLK